MTREQILALEAGPELDALVAEKIFGLTLNYEFNDYLGRSTVPALRDQYDEWGMLPEYSLDISAAWEVVTFMCCHEEADEDPFTLVIRYSLNATPGEYWTVSFWDGVFRADAKDSPLAICRAALLAVMGVE